MLVSVQFAIAIYEMDKLLEIIEKIGFPSAYHHFAEGESPNPPFLIYILPASDNFSADGRVYFKANEVHIEVYTDYKNLDIEKKVEVVLDDYGIFYNKMEIYIESEKLYKVLYIFEMEEENHGKSSKKNGKSINACSCNVSMF